MKHEYRLVKQGMVFVWFLQQQQVPFLQFCHCSFEGDQTAVPVATQFHLQVQLNLHHASN
jgi:hypothetical protein